MAGQVLREYMELAHLRRPESLNERFTIPVMNWRQTGC